MRGGEDEVEDSGENDPADPHARETLNRHGGEATKDTTLRSFSRRMEARSWGLAQFRTCSHNALIGPGVLGGSAVASFGYSAGSATRWLMNGIEPACPTGLRPTAQNGSVTFALLFYLALLRGRIFL